MNALITTTGSSKWIATTHGGAPGEATRQVWARINQQAPMEAGIAQPSGGMGEVRHVVFNPAQVISVHDLPE